MIKLILDHFLVGVTSHDENEMNKLQVFVMDMNTGLANTFDKVILNLKNKLYNKFFFHVKLFKNL